MSEQDDSIERVDYFMERFAERMKFKCAEERVLPEDQRKRVTENLRENLKKIYLKRKKN